MKGGRRLWILRWCIGWMCRDRECEASIIEGNAFGGDYAGWTSMQESITVIHTDDEGFSDYAITLTCTYVQESRKWVGVCEELGTSTFSDSLEDTQAELREALELQLNEVEGLGYVREYLASRV